ncbi:MAG: transcription termination factor Rho [Clostridiales bacterium]|nr:transcription termination factor Rho [Clostridiales bacterium]
MTEREALAQKSHDDLVEIAVAFNLVDREKAVSMDSDKLVSLIAHDEEVKDEKKEKPAKAAATKKKAPATKKKKTSEEKTEAEAVSEEKPKEEAKPKKRTSKKKEAEQPKTEEVKTKAEVSEEKPEEKADEKKPAKETKAKGRSKAKKETESSEEKKTKKTPARSKKKTEEKTPLEEMAENSAPSEETVPEKKEEAEAPAEKAPEAKPERPEGKAKKGKSKKRTLSFGPSSDDGKVVVTEVDPSTVEQSEDGEPAKPEVQEPQYIEVEGVLSIGNSDKGDFNGFVHRHNYLPGEEDAFVQGQLIRRLGLRRGDYIKGLAVAPKGKDKYAPLKRVLSVNGIELNEDTDLDIIRKRKRFETLTAVYPNEKLRLETAFGGSKLNDISTRIIDLFSPIGKGQRGMVASPPKAGKTILLQKIANAITANNPDCKLIVLLIDERPEEVTDMQRSVKGEVVYSTFDKRPENHVRVTELVLERAMRLVELGEDVVILLDSMTRLARAYNLTINPTGRTLSGGLDPGSLYGPKRFFGAARNIENGGSLTIIATALIETGSRMDEVIFEEFKGTGNMEITLDRKLADRRVFPAIAVDKSGTRREDLLLTPEELEAMILLRKKLADVDTTTATDAVINFMLKTTNNNSFVLSVKKSFSVDD